MTTTTARSKQTGIVFKNTPAERRLIGPITLHVALLYDHRRRPSDDNNNNNNNRISIPPSVVTSEAYIP